MHQQDGIGLPATQIVRPKRNDYYPVYTGRMIYDQLTMSGLNRVPVEMHKYRALRGFETNGALPIKGETMLELLLVEGSPVFHWNEEAEWEPVTNLIQADREDVYQLICGETYILRHFRQAGKSWRIYDTPLGEWSAYGRESEKVVATIAADELLVYENGRGIVYPNQWMYQRLEEIRWGIRQETSDFALSLLIIGMVSPNPEIALARLEAGKRIANIPGQGAQVERVGDSRIPDQLSAEYKDLEAEYFRACYLFDTSNQPERPVGLDLQLRLEPQAAFVEDLRRKIVETYAMLGYMEEISFTPLETQTVQDKAAIAQTMIALVEARLIDTTRATQIIAATFPK